ncbi:uncharacterized protein SPAPADRAFT_64511 [Spathaspora passalidarum NRRL Y-27907]|uniref:Structure-specific endonuclease subunit SLX4 n=1 Tax=Spathaspora passalidarum (strain NRRL Y-27907 / 11-Y1) TaxID=619300 RepID=G3AGP8_SPAPN|nr:uncharacterized protein SPAPADRAFT_64511 [Spathaspora passalidarum NRRL Y-27907]EGW35381.1 hypothetical protein SPAPADRAFT_64511 [Spathaspora passalidarum NRRL Y-27907]
MSDSEPGGGSLYFNSTQMQSRYEDLVEEETKTKLVKSKLNPFKNDIDKPILSTKKSIAKPRAKPKSRKQPKKNVSLNAHVRQSFENNADKFSYFAGNQSKLDDFIKRITRAEDVEHLTHKSNTKLWTPSEWKYIVNSIRLKFPVLPRASKMTLKAINKRMMLQSMNEESQEDGGSMWSQACSHPSTEMSNEDIKSLYELNEEQMNGSSFIEEEHEEVSPFVMSLNVDEKLKSDSTISDSESEPEIISEHRIKKLSSPEIVEENLHKSLVQVSESIYDNNPHQPPLDPTMSFQSFSFARQDQVYEVIESDVESVKSPSKPIALSSPTKISKTTSPIESPFTTPTILTKQILNSRPTSISRRSPIKLINQSFESPIQQEIIISSDEESIHSTAKSSITTDSKDLFVESQDMPVSSMPIPKSQKRKTLTTTRLQISNALIVSDYEDSTVKLRKISENNRIIIDLDAEIPDSESSDDDFSIIEITREVKPEEGEPNTSGQDVSVVQVPSSPITTTEHSLTVATNIPSEISSLKATELSKKFKAWGLKPVQGKSKMLEILTNITHFIDPINLTNLDTQQTFQQSVFIKLTQLIRSDQLWYDRILSYEPIRIDELKQWLATQSYILEPDLLQMYCDNHSVTTTN